MDYGVLQLLHVCQEAHDFYTSESVLVWKVKNSLYDMINHYKRFILPFSGATLKILQPNIL